MPTPRKVPDDLWAEIEPLLPLPPPRSNGGRPRADERNLLDAMLYILWTGAPWRALPPEFGPWQTVYDRFAEWEQAKVFEHIWQRCLYLYDQAHGIDWAWQAGDGTYVRSPLGGKETGPNPTDRAKAGVKDHLLSDRRGVPLSVLVTPANVNDSPMLAALLAQQVAVRPRPTRHAPHHLCLDAAYDNAPAHRVVLQENYQGHISPKAGRDESLPPHQGAQARRWVIERLHAWHDRFRRLVNNWEKKLERRNAFICLANALIAYRT